MYNTNQLANHRRKAVIAAITCFIVIVVLVLVAWAIISAISGSNKFNNSPIGVDDPASSSNTSKKPSTSNTNNTNNASNISNSSNNSSSTSNKPQTNTTNNSSSNTSSSSTQNTQNTQTTSNTSTKPSTPVNTAPITSAPEENIPTTGPADHLVAILALGVATALGVRLYQSRQNRLLFD